MNLNELGVVVGCSVFPLKALNSLVLPHRAKGLY